MAFTTRLGSLLRQSITKHLGSSISPSIPSIYHAVRGMSSRLFVGGISYGIDDQTLREAFSSFGDVVEARIINDRETGRSRGFGFVTFASQEEATAAIEGLNQKELHGRIISVNIAQERTYGGGYGRGGYGGGGYGGGGYGGGGSYGSGGGYGGGGYADGGGASYGGSDSGSYGSSGGGSSYGGSDGGSYGGSDSGSYGSAGGGGNSYGDGDSGSYGPSSEGGASHGGSDSGSYGGSGGGTDHYDDNDSNDSNDRIGSGRY